MLDVELYAFVNVANNTKYTCTKNGIAYKKTIKTWTAANNGESVNVRRSTSGPQLFQCTLSEINKDSITSRRERKRLKIKLKQLLNKFNLISLLAAMSSRTGQRPGRR